MTVNSSQSFDVIFMITYSNFHRYVVAAISPGVVVPTMLILQERGYGVDKG